MLVLKSGYLSADRHKASPTKAPNLQYDTFKFELCREQEGESGAKGCGGQMHV